jgi:predicted KAP-like P-loop ATPase
MNKVSEERIASIFRVENPRAWNQREQMAADWSHLCHITGEYNAKMNADFNRLLNSIYTGWKK